MLWLLMTCILRGIMLLGPKANIYANMVGEPNAIIPAAMGVSMVPRRGVRLHLEQLD